MRKLLISSAVAATVLATAGIAKVATDGTGQFLLAPGFFAQDGFETKLKLVNTDLTHSVLYRAAIREYEASQEIDFIITLSPGDVWEGRIYKGADGVYVESKDTSTYRNSLANPVKISSIYEAANAVPRSFAKGYVEFYPIASYNEGNDKIVDKDKLYDRFDDLAGGDTAGADPVGNDQVAGYATVASTTLNAVMTIPMMAFEDVAIDPVSTPAAAGEDTVPGTYVNEATIFGDLSHNTVTVPFEGGGVNDGIYLAFWNDHFNESEAGCKQYRGYNVISRDMDENRGTPTVSNISPKPETAENTVKCEFGTIQVKNILNLAGTPNYTSGMVQLVGIETDAGEQKSNADKAAAIAAVDGNKAAFAATNMSARPINGTYSFSWVYAPVK